MVAIQIKEVKLTYRVKFLYLIETKNKTMDKLATFVLLFYQNEAETHKNIYNQ